MLIPISDPSDPRIADYTGLRDAHTRYLGPTSLAVDEAVVFISDAIRTDDYPPALTIANDLNPLASRLRHSDAAADFAAESKRVHDLAGEYPRVKQAMAKLATTPDDPASNALAGRFLCLRKQDWQAGLPMLV